MSRVWDDAGIQDHSELLVLLALADFCNEAGECWPSIAVIARKSRLTERAVYDIIDRLVTAKRLVKEPGGGRNIRNRYRIINPEANSVNGIQRIQNTVSGSVETLNGVHKNPEPASGPIYNHHRTIIKPSIAIPPQFVTREMVREWCVKKKFSDMTNFAWGKLMGGKYYGRPITNVDDFHGAMASIHSEYLKE